MCSKKKHKGQKEKKIYICIKRKERNKEIKKGMLADKSRQFVKCTFRPTKTFQHSHVKGVRTLFLLFFCVKLVKNACLCYMRLIPVLHMG